MPTTHQNGACRVEIHVTDPNGETYSMAFSGDIGPENSLLYKQKLPYTSKKIDCLVLEVLHGIKEPEETLQTSIKRLREIIQKGIRQKKHIVLAGFSLDRNAMLVYLLNEFRKQGVYVHMAIDSPLTMCQLGIYQSTYRTSGYWFKDLGPEPFDDSDFEVIKNYRAHSFSVNHGEAPRVIVTASATGSGGRIVDYFEAGIERPDYVFVFCGWSAPDSPSSILHDARYGQIVEMPERRYVKRCKTYRLHGFSSHGYFPEVIEAIADYQNCKALVLNHARNEDRQAVQEKISDFFEGDIVTPEYYDAYIFSKAGVVPVEHEDALLDFETVIDRNVVRMEYEKFFEDEDDDDFVEGELFP
jgi:predicted metal-dependent RNase